MKSSAVTIIGFWINCMVFRAKHNNICFVICFNDFSVYIFFCLGSIKIFGGLICVQCFYNFILKTLMSLFFSSVIKRKAMMDEDNAGDFMTNQFLAVAIFLP